MIVYARIPAVLTIDTAQLRYVLNKFSIALTKRESGLVQFYSGLPCLLCLSLIWALADFRDGILTIQQWNYAFSGAVGIALALTISGASSLRESRKHGGIQQVSNELCKASFDNNERMAKAEAIESENRTEWVENDLVQKNMRYYG